MKTIATHDGIFHTDDVFAVAILKLIYPEIKIIRSRDSKEFCKADFKVDIGKIYHPDSGKFDHHQKEFCEIRKNKIPYASAGLIWKHFGEKLTNSKKAFDYIDEKLMQPIDAIDCGVSITQKEIIPDYCIRQVILSFKPNWQEINPEYDKAFEKAVKFATNLLFREIRSANSIEKAEKIIKEIISKSDKDYLILGKNIPFHTYVIENTNLKYVIEENLGGDYIVWAVKISTNSFRSRKPFPKKWAGLDGKDLVKVTGVKDAMFCHKDLFIAGAKSKEGAIKLVEMALKEK